MIRSTPKLISLLSTAVLAFGFTGSASAADAARGKLLYDTRCGACHNTSVHQSTSRKATSLPGVRAQVVRWGEQLGTSWGTEDIEDITTYLNDLYYRLPCPPATCPTKTGTLGAAR